MTGQNIRVERSRLLAGIFPGLGAAESQAGNLRLNATDKIELTRGTIIENDVGTDASGNGGNLEITAESLSITEDSQLSASTLGQGNAGRVTVNAYERILLDGIGSSGRSSGVFASASTSGKFQAGNITLRTPSFRIANGAVVSASTESDRPGGDITISANRFTALNGGQVITTTSGRGQAGNITLNAGQVTLSGRDLRFAERLQRFGGEIAANEGNGESGLFASTNLNSRGNGGSVTVHTNNLFLDDSALVSAQSLGEGTAGNIRLNARERLQVTNSSIVTEARNSSGGDIFVNVADNSRFGIVVLRNGDLITNSSDDGGNIALQGEGIVAFGDSDILARSAGGRGGNISLGPFFSETQPPDSTQPFDGDGEVDVNADGEIAAGLITTPDTSFIQNNLTELPETAIDTDSLVSNSCIARSRDQAGSFIITGTGGLPVRPGDSALSSYPTGAVRSISDESVHTSLPDRPWQLGDSITEPQGVYQLSDGRLVISRECS